MFVKILNQEICFDQGNVAFNIGYHTTVVDVNKATTVNTTMVEPFFIEKEYLKVKLLLHLKCPFFAYGCTCIVCDRVGGASDCYTIRHR